jgi:hypothetical protein
LVARVEHQIPGTDTVRTDSVGVRRQPLPFLGQRLMVSVVTADAESESRLSHSSNL